MAQAFVSRRQYRCQSAARRRVFGQLPRLACGDELVDARNPCPRRFKAARKIQRMKFSIESLMRRRRVKFELRESSPEEFSYEVQLPMDMKTDTLSAEIMELDPDKGTAVNWSPEKKKVA